MNLSMRHIQNILKGRRYRSGQYGFTLIELLVSLTITALILALIISGIQLVSNSWDRTAKKISRIEEVNRALSLFRRDVQRIKRIILKENNKSEYLFSGTSKDLEFVVIEPGYPTISGPYFIRYSSDEKSPQVSLIRERALYKKGMEKFPGATASNRVSILSHELEHKLSFGELKNDTMSWSTGWEQSDKLPHMIRFEITDKRSNVLVVPPILVALRINAEQGCISSGVQICSAKSDGRLKTIPAKEKKKRIRSPFRSGGKEKEND